MKRPGDHDDDVAALLEACRSLPPPRAGAARTERHRRAIADAIAAEHHAGRRALSPLAAAAIAFVVAGAAIAGTVVAVSRGGHRAVEEAPAINDGPHEARPVADTVVHRPTTVKAAPEAVPTGDVDGRGVAALPAPVRRHTPTAPVARSKTERIDALLREAPLRRSETLRVGVEFQRAPDDVDAAIAAAIDSAEGDAALASLRRLRCELHLRYVRDENAVDICRVFTRLHPDDSAARPLAFGAGGLAEELGLLDDAVDQYTHAIVLAPLSGQSSADALRARARVHARAGRTVDAIADLRIFLRLRPAAALDDDVVELAARLGVDVHGVASP